MSSSPAETIRTYLDRNGGQISVPFHNLLTTWQLEQAGQAERERIQQELSDAGLAVEPPLADLGPDDELKVGIAPEPVEEPAEEQPVSEDELPRDPPWASELQEAQAQPAAAARTRGRSLPRELPRLQGAQRELVALALVLLSGGFAAAAGYVLGKGF
jgi:hypothetical protein